MHIPQPVHALQLHQHFPFNNQISIIVSNVLTLVGNRKPNLPSNLNPPEAVIQSSEPLINPLQKSTPNRILNLEYSPQNPLSQIIN